MKKELMTSLAALVIAMGAGCNNGCAPNIQPPRVSGQTTSSTYQKPNSRFEALDSILRSTVCLRNETTYRSSSSSHERGTAGYGTGFVIDADNQGNSYILTNNHVVSSPDSGVALDPTTNLPTIYNKKVVKIYVVQGQKCAISDSRGDLASVVATSEDSDLGLLRINKRLPVSRAYKNNSITARPGDIVYMFGYPRALFKSVTRGMISNTGITATIKNPQDMIDITGTFGSSGSSYFIERDGVLHYGGVINSLLGQSRENNSRLFMFGIPYSTVKKFLNDNRGG